ncbi:MAG: EAL domain-containing protein [Hyphomicrobiales bacterium]
MARLKAFLSVFMVDRSNPALVHAQLRAFARQVPLLYAILIANTAFVAATHFTFAPISLTIGLPAVFIAVAAMRLAGWWRMQRSTYTTHDAIHRLNVTLLLVAVLGTAFTMWGLALFPYGDTFAKTHIVFYMAFTLIGSVFCLMHYRAAAFLLALTVIVPFIAFLLTQGNAVFSAIAFNFALVTAGMLFIVNTHYKDFALMVAQREHLETVNRETLRLSEDNRALAHRDSLTGLPNRRSFIAEAEARVAACAQGKTEGFSLGLVDLDGFKAVNDLYGHAAGDALLMEASRRMTEIAGTNIIFARIGGDEFGILATSGTDLAAFGRTLCEVLRQPYELSDLTAEVTASCGFASYGPGCDCTSQLFEFADYALYEAKDRTGGQTVIFSASHRDELRRRHEIDQRLRNADLNAELALAYQPVINTRTGELVAVEALARWMMQGAGSISPSQFIAIAEKSTVINTITFALLRKLLNDLRQWPEALSASFNLSARTLASAEVMLQLLNMVRSSGITPSRLEFEVTETVLVADFDAARRAIQMLRNLGCRVALDDFGIGHSSLSHIHQLPLDKIKIDRKFVGDMAGSEKAASVVGTIVDLCRNLGLVCVAEGVETVEQVDLLAARGCHLAQGYLYGKPVPARDVLSLLARHGLKGERKPRQVRRA